MKLLYTALLSVLFAGSASAKTAAADSVLISGTCSVDQVSKSERPGQEPVYRVVRSLEERAIYLQAASPADGLRVLADTCASYRTEAQKYFGAMAQNAGKPGYVFPSEIKSGLLEDVYFISLRDAQMALHESIESGAERKALSQLQRTAATLKASPGPGSITPELTKETGLALQILQSEPVMKRVFKKLKPNPLAVALGSMAIWRYRGSHHDYVGTGGNRVISVSLLAALWGSAYGADAMAAAFGMAFSIPLAGSYGGQMDIGIVNGNAWLDTARMSAWGLVAGLPVAMAVIHRYGLPWQKDQERAAKSRKGLWAIAMAGLMMGPSYALAWQFVEKGSDRIKGTREFTATALGECLFGLALGIAMNTIGDDIDRSDYKKMSADLRAKLDLQYGSSAREFRPALQPIDISRLVNIPAGMP